eukprot:CAMPEP_0115504922 /NCGR_PEP_ID=MMETSP0271-20121206/70281_1 /TAXON_ID=71861 /ORGANISM="Scrippsiella trochoidea, Strain CCMP3099" /LENGTH=406 /DNA_ID=CAMNT_0002934139 /DNA_START=1 /DNA_END=1221 /DNA_ORIENTATION=-
MTTMVGGDPRTWTPTFGPEPIGGDPRTWSPTHTHVPAHGRAVVAGGGGGGMVVAGGGGGGGAGGCAAVCCGEAAGPALMTYVGGGGSYTTETNYKYVGRGAGEFSYMTPKTTNVMLFVVPGILVLVLIVLVLLFIGGSTTTTTPKVVGPAGDCLLWGDPHVETFDHGFPNFYEEGEYWVVKSPNVYIQARYLATPFTNGLSATHQVAVGGPFLGGHKIVVGPMENGQITFDGQAILLAFPSTFSDASGVQLSYNGEGKLVDNAQGHLEKHIVHMDLPLGVHLQVMRWANHLNVRISMTPREGGQDGSCGNFNGNVADDSTAAIKSRIAGQRVAPSDLLFNVPAQVGPGGQHVTIADCAQAKRDHAMEVCKAQQPAAEGKLLESCIFDVCFAGEQYAGEDGLAESEA